jgi:hypothetical protein
MVQLLMDEGDGIFEKKIILTAEESFFLNGLRGCFLSCFSFYSSLNLLEQF